MNRVDSEPSTSAIARRRKRRRATDRRGVALIITLGALSVLSIFATQLREEAAADLASALAERDSVKAEYFARSAVNLARLLIAIEPQIRKSLPLPIKTQIPVWAFTDMVLGPFNDASGVGSFNGMINADPTTGKNLGLGGGRFELKIVDEESKINVNLAAHGDPISQDKIARQLLGLMSPPQYQTLFDEPDLDNQRSDRQQICSALVDWADDNAVLYACDPFAQAAGAASAGNEDNFYQTLNLGYSRRDSAFDSLEELRLVRGVGDDFWTTFIDPDPNDPTKRVLTVWGLDRINVNTASPMAVLGLVCSDDGSRLDPKSVCNDPVQLQSFIMGISMLRSFLSGIPIFQSANDFVDAMQGKGFAGGIFAAIGVQPVTFKLPNELKKQVGMKSQMFSIYAEGIVTGNRSNWGPSGSQFDSYGNPITGMGTATQASGAAKRSPRVRIHAVVDFRTATDLGAPAMLPGGTSAAAQAGLTGGAGAMPLAGAGATGVAPGGAQAAGSGSNGQPSIADYEKMLTANPAGKVVYWRVE